MRALFEIEWPDEHGKGWLSVENLEACLTTSACCAPGTVTGIRQFWLTSGSRINPDAQCLTDVPPDVTSGEVPGA